MIPAETTARERWTPDVANAAEIRKMIAGGWHLTEEQMGRLRQLLTAPDGGPLFVFHE